ncbi:MAG TPA: hypothetical protein VLE48_13700, partial [Terriglobales bacterium]|nr:hypothetical protein [Terriglobales bacterium]
MTRATRFATALVLLLSVTTLVAAAQEAAPEKAQPAAESAAASEAKAPPEAAPECGELCDFIRTVLKEAPKSFQALRGEVVGIHPAQYAGKLSLPGLDCMALARLYSCSLP